MLRYIWAQLRGRAGRSIALLTGLFVATAGFTVLTGTTETSRLQVTGEVRRDTRAAYDILVRPKGTQTPLETSGGLVQPNYLSGLYGGITTGQYEQVRGVTGIDVAAPIAMVGYSTLPAFVEVDVTAQVDPSLERQVIRIEPTFSADRGLSTAVGRPSYIYLTKRPLVWPLFQAGADMSQAVTYSDGSTSMGEYANRGCGAAYPPLEVQPDGSRLPICMVDLYAEQGEEVNTDLRSTTLLPAQLLPDGRFLGPMREEPSAPPAPSSKLVGMETWTLPVLLAAIDPAAEARLTGLDAAMDSGTYLTGTERASRHQRYQNLGIPVITTSRPYVEGAMSVRFSRFDGAGVAGAYAGALVDRLDSARGTPVPGGATFDINDAYERTMRQFAGASRDPALGIGQLAILVKPGPPRYERLPDGSLAAVPVPVEPRVYRGSGFSAGLTMPWMIGDGAVRPVTRYPSDVAILPAASPIGSFDPMKLSGFSDLTRVPLETYEPPQATGADERSRQLLGDKPLLPGGNPGGYLSAPPLMLTSLSALPDLYSLYPQAPAAAPISAIRVRVSDVDGYTPESAERVRLVAEEIANRTGLAVDVTFGSSPAPQTVELPAGAYGRPALRLAEGWSRKGVAASIVQAVDRKSVVLFLLVLVVCALFLTNAVSAAVRDRRPQLALLSCLGWPARRIGAVILGEVALIGLAAGLLAVAVAVPVGRALGVQVGWERAAFAVPVALGLALLAGAVPALRASRAHPAGALRPVTAGPRGGWHPRRISGLAFANLIRVPGRTLLGAASLAIGTCALTVLLAILYAFHGAIVGSLLGDAVSLTVRRVDLIAVVATVGLGAFAVADVMYLNIRDRAAELAALHATGWSATALARLVVYEGLGVGLLGGVAGAALGVAGAAWLVDAVTGSLLWTAAGTVAVAVAAAGFASLLPAILLRRLPTAALLAEE